MSEHKTFQSLCVKDGPASRTTKAHQLPIYASSSFEFESIDQGIDIFTGQQDGHVYGRYANPTIDSVSSKIAAMEGFGLDVEPFAIMCSSGMSAISTAIMSILKSGDTILTQGNLYGGTTELFKDIMARFGVNTIFTDLTDLNKVSHDLGLHPEVKLIFMETPTNPTITVIDLEGIANLAKQNGVKTMVDNTVCTPYLQRPFQYGIDISIHSSTKFLNGHGQTISGVIVAHDHSLKASIWKSMKLIGTNSNPFDAWMLNHGLKTLKLRMDAHSNNAQALATYLSTHPKVKQVNYCGLPSHPQHNIAKRQMSQCSGLLSFDVDGGTQSSLAVMNALRFATLAPTLGDVDTLILHPATMSHLNVDPAVRLQNGITDGLIRVSVGIEDIDDIVADFDQALASI